MTQVGGKLLDDVLGFIRQHGLTETQFGAMSVKSTQLVFSLRRGRKCGPKVEEKVRAFMAAGNPRPNTRAGTAAQKYAETVRRNAAAERHATLFRTTDEAERAKTFIRARTPFYCFNAEITRPQMIGWYFIGSRLVDRQQLLDYAKERGWEG